MNGCGISIFTDSAARLKSTASRKGSSADAGASSESRRKVLHERTESQDSRACNVHSVTSHTVDLHKSISLTEKKRRFEQLVSPGSLGSQN